MSLYLSGSPGSGKTALVQDVLTSLEKENDDLRVVFINCMGMSELGIAGVMRRVLEDVAPQKRVAKIAIEEAFANLMRQNVKWCVSEFHLVI